MVEPHKPPCMVKLNNDLNSLQKAVSIGADEQGLIELVHLEDNVYILCNEEGKLIGLEPNRILGRDILCGVFYVCGQDRCGNLTSLKDDKLEFYKDYFAKRVIISPEDVADSVFVEFIPLEDEE
jgi:hypothetical protein